MKRQCNPITAGGERRAAICRAPSGKCVLLLLYSIVRRPERLWSVNPQSVSGSLCSADRFIVFSLFGRIRIRAQRRGTTESIPLGDSIASRIRITPCSAERLSLLKRDSSKFNYSQDYSQSQSPVRVELQSAACKGSFGVPYLSNLPTPANPWPAGTFGNDQFDLRRYLMIRHMVIHPC